LSSQEEIPPWLREQLARFEQAQQSLQAIMVQKQQVDMELSDIDKALSELNKVADDESVYKTAGSLLIKVKKLDIMKELEEKKELATTRSMVLTKQENRMKETVKDLQTRINEAIRGKPSIGRPTANSSSG
jgi:prefoldin beta subunit